MVLGAWRALVHKEPPSHDRIVEAGKDLLGCQVQLGTEKKQI